ncbi:hypothetical protein L6164_034359 [Bauhinia variegata]|uniref:Uncharacterized protein n=1 Tax=Bauhinia variegata TaxID=167791 RepID=A0ACB9KV42_BAUVA|nr:hypothetical protein L6164_034359 [Bauhinia variegata]
MAPNPRVTSAYRAMKVLGIEEVKVKPVLKKLLKLYDKNWELIEAENYRVLADSIFQEEEENQGERWGKKKLDEEDMEEDEEAHMHDEPVRPLKRLRLRGRESQASQPMAGCGPRSPFPSQMIKPKNEEGSLPESSSRQQPQNKEVSSPSDMGHGRIEVRPLPSRDRTTDKGKQPVSPQVAMRGKNIISERVLPSIPSKEPTGERGTGLLLPHTHTLIIPKDEPIDELPVDEVPIAVIHPDSFSGRDSPIKNGTAGKHDGHEALASKYRGSEVRGKDIVPSSHEEEANGEVATLSQECRSDVEIASSSLGEEISGKITPRLKESSAHDGLSVRGNVDMRSCSSNGSINTDAGHIGKVRRNDFPGSDNKKGLSDPKSPNSGSLVVSTQHQLTQDDLRSIHDCKDITKGEEYVSIAWVNENTNDFPPPFHYIPHNLVFHEAYVRFSLSQIGVKDCCSSCLGSCLLSSTPCACANKTGGGFAYTAEGTVKEAFLEECIAISRKRQVHNFYCKDCPLERSRNDGFVEPCKGHIKRKFIKECWSKCGCGKQCGNRVVQRGITSKLQVFFTPEGKGWGLRTLEDLPKGDVKDKEALCLDAASYGNVARFINHRCLDANLIEIPVEVDAPDRHYYHLALFTSREIAAQEELTWDYGIDFDDQDHPIKPFLCTCGSKFCRKMSRSNRSIRSSSTTL